MKCPSCNIDIAEDAIKCGQCGYVLSIRTQESAAINNSYDQDSVDNISKTPNAIIMKKARESLKGRMGLVICALLITLVCNIAPQFIPVIGTLFSLLIAGPLATGYCIFFLALSRNQNPKVSNIFEGFKKFGASVGACFLAGIFIFLWSLLLLIPGIIAALSYSLTFFIIAESDEIGPLEAIKKSKELMNGNKWKLFCLSCRFIGWCLLGVLTLGIAMLWVLPYMQLSFTKFYEDIVKKHEL